MECLFCQEPLHDILILKLLIANYTKSMRYLLLFIILIPFISKAQNVGINLYPPQFTLDVKELDPNLGATFDLKDASSFFHLRFFSGNSSEKSPYVGWHNFHGLRFGNIDSGIFEEKLRLMPTAKNLFRIDLPSSTNILIGHNAGNSLENTVTNNLFIGESTGLSQALGNDNIYIGNYVGPNGTTTATKNVVIGSESATGGNENVYLGYFINGTIGNQNTYIGSEAGIDNYSGSRNVFIGYNTTLEGSDKLAINNAYSSNQNPPLISGDFSGKKVGINTTDLQKDLTIHGQLTSGLMIRTEDFTSSNKAGIFFQNGELGQQMGEGGYILSAELTGSQGLVFNSESSNEDWDNPDILIVDPEGEVKTADLSASGRFDLNSYMQTNPDFTLYHDDISYSSGNNLLPWIRRGSSGITGDYVYIAPSGNRPNTDQHAALIKTDGIYFGSGDQQGDALSTEWAKLSETSTGQGKLEMFKHDGTRTVEIISGESTTTGSQIALYKPNGVLSIEIDADYNGDGRIITDELQIKGGSDLAEHFDIEEENAFKAIPGMLVSIDPHHVGKLKVAHAPHDKKIAGVISGANGIEPGMLMGQEGTIAYGAYPVALAGRVYVYTTDEGGTIEPGDFLTSSSTKGYAMKVRDISSSYGSIIGKAMSFADPDTGFVLVLVNLQ